MFIGSFQISVDHIINDDFKDISKGLKPVNGEGTMTCWLGSIRSYSRFC
jgi:hypothetical protein